MNRQKSLWPAVAGLVIILLSAAHAAVARTMIEGTVMGTGANKLFVVAANGEHIDFAVPTGTQIMRDGQTAQLDQLQGRDQVSVAASQSGEELVATHIFARSPY